MQWSNRQGFVRCTEGMVDVVTDVVWNAINLIQVSGKKQTHCLTQGSIHKSDSQRRCNYSLHDVCIWRRMDDGQLQERCGLHAETDMINLLEKTCKSCDLGGLTDVASVRPAIPRCSSEACCPHTPPAPEQSQWRVRRSVLMVDGEACVRQRPDFLFWTNTVVLECDEHHHQRSDMWEEPDDRHRSSAGRDPLPVYVRVNPDGWDRHRTSSFFHQNVWKPWWRCQVHHQRVDLLKRAGKHGQSLVARTCTTGF
jgi:hypothetical protein